MTVSVAVLMTCFNRRAVTLRCLHLLELQTGLDDVTVSVYLVNDGSSDGTEKAVAEAYPAVRIIQGTGSLFWAGGMRLADEVARMDQPDFLLWLNDDVELAAGGVRQLLDVANDLQLQSVVVGAVSDPATGDVAYGGYLCGNRKRPFDTTRVMPSGRPVEVDTMNGNVVLVPRALRDVLGPPDRAFSHNMADMDYAYRAISAGFRVHQAGEFVGTCAGNPQKSRWRDGSVGLRERLTLVVSKRGLPPLEWLRYTRRHCGWRWPRYFVSPYVRAVLARRLPPG